MSDIFVVGGILILIAIGVLIWYLAKRKQIASKPQMPLREFFVTIFALFNSFIVIVLGIFYTHGGSVKSSWVIAGVLFALGILGVMFAYLDSFWKRQARQDVVLKAVHSPKKPK